MFKARTAQEAADYCKPQLKNYLNSRGINTEKNFRCINPEHNDAHPSMSIDERHNRCKCFSSSCGKSYDIFNACEILEGKNKSDAFKTVLDFCDCRIENGTAPAGSAAPHTEERGPKKGTATMDGDKTNHAKYISKCRERMKTERENPGREYLKARGIEDFTIDRFNVGFDPYNPKGPIVVFGYTNGMGYNSRNLTTAGDKEARFFGKGKNQAAGFFGTPGALEEETEQPLFVCEGEIDALSISEASGVDVLATGGNVSAEQIDILKNHARRPIAIALDNDAAGIEAAQELEKALKDAGKTVYIADIYGTKKDANEALLENQEKFGERIRAAWEAAAAEAEEKERAYVATHSAAALIGPFLKHIETAPPAIPTGFLGLDAALDGGIFPGLYVLGGISSLGKTSLCLQIADNIAETGRDVLFFSLEMSRYELMARSISRKTFDPEGERWNAKTARAIMQNEVNYNREERENFERAVREYTTTAQHLFIREGMETVTAETVREAVAEHKAATGAAPIVFVDYLQILQPMGDRLSDKQAIDAGVLKLKQTSRDYNIPVFAISSFNRESYKNNGGNNGEVSMADYKESGAIEYSADVLIGLQFTAAGKAWQQGQEKTEKAKDPREITAVVLKNRNGKAYADAQFYYYPKFNTFSDTDEQWKYDCA